ncbi:MAG: MFS transporter [Alphaproteobacteria bacterium]|nr:MFS transporter [Alphaproteobacteria bacterium]
MEEPRDESGWSIDSVRVVASFTVITIISQFYRSAVAVIAPDLAVELSLSPEALGAVGGGFFIGIAAMQLPVGILLDRFGARRTTPLLLALAVIGAVEFSQAHGFWGLLFGQVLIGMGCAGVFMGALVTISRWFPVQRFAMVGSFVVAISGIGLLLSATPLAWVSELIGWRHAFLLVAAATALFGAFVFILARDAPPDHDYHRRPPESLASTMRGLREIFRHHDLPALLAITFVAYAAVFAVRGLWGGPYLSDVHGLGPVARGNVLFFLSLGTIGGILIFGPLDSFLGRRRMLILGGATLSVLILTALALAPSLPIVVVTLLFALLGASGAYSMSLIAHGRALFSDHLVGRAVTVVNFANFVGVGVIQIVSGVIIGLFPESDGQPPEAAYRAVFGFIAVALAVAAILYSRAPEPGHIRRTEGDARL